MPTIQSEGTTLLLESGTPGTFAPVAQVLRVGAVKKKVAAVKTTFLTSTFQTYRPGRIPDNGEVVFRVAYDPNLPDHQALYDALDSGDTLNWKIQYVDGKTTPASVTFAGFLTIIEEDDKEDESNVEADVTIQVTGPATRTPGTP